MPRSRLPSAIILSPDGKAYPYKIPSTRQIKAAFRPFAHELGYLAVVWNQLHDNLLSIFVEVLTPADDFAAKAIWYSTDSDFHLEPLLNSIRRHFSTTLYLPGSRDWNHSSGKQYSGY